MSPTTFDTTNSKFYVNSTSSSRAPSPVYSEPETELIASLPRAVPPNGAAFATTVTTGEKQGPGVHSNGGIMYEVDVQPGGLPEEVYDSTLIWWRAGLRRMVVSTLMTESRWLAAMQTRVRNKYLDAYFLYASSLGTHTFFMTLLPAVYFFGYDRAGRGLVTVLGMGVYWSSFLKDLLCTPRPFTPPVTRLTIGKHHLEYGFPSTHSTNCVSMVLYMYTLILRSDVSATTLHVLQAVLVVYTITIIYGRLYCGMHSITDVVGGCLVGAAVWGTHCLVEEWLERWLASTGWFSPALMITTAMIMVNRHPQPVDDCPCFEDAIAFVASILGVLVGFWHGTYFGFFNPGLLHTHPTWTAAVFFGALKLFFGVLCIFSWRLTAKPLLHTLLPVLYRLAARSKIIDITSKMFLRRFYTPATAYAIVPPKRKGLGGLDAIPSVIDLPSELEVYERDKGVGNGVGGMNGREGLKLRNARTNGYLQSEKARIEADEKSDNTMEDVVPMAREEHYDAEVLTKVIVYSGIGILASEGMPLLFGVLGW